MIKFTRHYPAFVERRETAEHGEVATVHELLVVPWVTE